MQLTIFGDQDLYLFSNIRLYLLIRVRKRKPITELVHYASSHFISLAKDKILIAIPENKARRKVPFIDVQAVLKPSFFQTLNTPKLMIVYAFNKFFVDT